MPAFKYVCNYSCVYNDKYTVGDGQFVAKKEKLLRAFMISIKRLKQRLNNDQGAAKRSGLKYRKASMVLVLKCDVCKHEFIVP